MQKQELTLGLILLKEGKISKDQLKRALLKQGEIRRFGRYQRLGEVIARLGFLSEDQVAEAVEIQSTLTVQGAHNTLLGLLLVEAGLLTPSQVFEALMEQQTSEKRLGQILQERGVLTEEQLAPLLAKQAEERHAAEARLQEEMKSSGLIGGDDDDFVIFDFGSDEAEEGATPDGAAGPTS
jgi:hypothetical protein